MPFSLRILAQQVLCTFCGYNGIWSIRYKKEVDEMDVLTVNGRVVDDPEVKEVGDDRKVCNFRVASRNGVDGDGDERTKFFDVAVWGPYGENCGKFLEKGQAVSLVGDVSANAWESDKNGVQAPLKINANNVEFGSKSKKAGSDADEDIKF